MSAMPPPDRGARRRITERDRVIMQAAIELRVEIASELGVPPVTVAHRVQAWREGTLAAHCIRELTEAVERRIEL